MVPRTNPELGIWDEQTLTWVLQGLRNRAPIFKNLFIFLVTRGCFPTISSADVARPLGETASDQSVVWFGITQGPDSEERDCHVWGSARPHRDGVLVRLQAKGNGQTHK